MSVIILSGNIPGIYRRIVSKEVHNSVINNTVDFFESVLSIPRSRRFQIEGECTVQQLSRNLLNDFLNYSNNLEISKTERFCDYLGLPY